MSNSLGGPPAEGDPPAPGESDATIIPTNYVTPAIVPRYRTPTPNEPIELYEGPLILSWDDNECQGSGNITLVWQPYPRVRFEFNVQPSDAFGGPMSFGNEPSAVTLSLPDNAGSGSAHVLGTSFSVGGVEFRYVLQGAVDGLFRRGNPAPTDAVVFHIANFPDYIGSFVGEEGAFWSARHTALAEPWRVELDSVGDHQELRKLLGDSGGFAITHTGRLDRIDGRPVSFEDAEKLIPVLYRWLSMARGERTEPVLVVGMHEGEACWELWGTPSIAPWFGWRGWLPRTLLPPIEGAQGVDLGAILARLLAADPDEFKILSRAINWYNQSIENGFGATSTVLAQAGLELVSWMRIVSDIGLSEDSFGKMHASDALRLALAHAGVPFDIPESASELLAAAREWNLDGPAAVVELRNSVVHPKSRVRFSSDRVGLEGTFLGIWYLELLLLYRLGYSGPTHNRIEWLNPEPGDSLTSVPWTTSVVEDPA